MIVLIIFIINISLELVLTCEIVMYNTLVFHTESKNIIRTIDNAKNLKTYGVKHFFVLIE